MTTFMADTARHEWFGETGEDKSGLGRWRFARDRIV